MAQAAAALVQKHSRVKRARALRAVRAGEDAECEAVDSPGCEAFVDIMNTFQGRALPATKGGEPDVRGENKDEGTSRTARI